MDAVDHDVHLEATTFNILDDAFKDVLVSGALTDNVDVGVSVFHQQEGIGYQSQRRCVDDDIVVSFLEFLEQFVGSLGGDEFCWVGRNRTGSDDVETVNLSRWLDHLIQ